MKCSLNLIQLYALIWIATAQNATDDCVISTPTNFQVYVFKIYWPTAGEMRGIELFWSPTDQWCGTPSRYDVYCAELAEDSIESGAKNTKIIWFPPDFDRFRSVNCSVRAVNANGLNSEWTTQVVDLEMLKPAPWLITASYNEDKHEADAACLELPTADVIPYMSNWNKLQQRNCSKWPMLQDYNCCYETAGMVLRPLHKKSFLMPDIQLPNVACPSSEQVYDFCLDWVGWKTYDIRECPDNPRDFCIHAIDNTQPWVLTEPIYHTSNPTYRILCFPFKSRIFWTEQSGHYYVIKLSDTRGHAIPLNERCSCAAKLSLISPTVTLDWRTYHAGYKHPAIDVITTNGVWQIIMSDEPHMCMCLKVMELPQLKFEPTQIAVDWVFFYWISAEHDIFSYDWHTGEIGNITGLVPSKFGKIVQLQSLTAEFRNYAPVHCYYPNFTIQTSMIKKTSGQVEIQLLWNNSEECREMSRPPTTIMVYHAPSLLTRQCDKFKNPMLSDCLFNYDRRNRKVNPKFGISQLLPNQSYFVEVWVKPFDHYSSDEATMILPYEPNPYGDNPNPVQIDMLHGWLSKTTSFSSIYTAKRTISTIIFVVSTIALIVLLPLISCTALSVYHDFKWRKFKDIPRIRASELEPVKNIGGGHFGDVMKEKYKSKLVATKHLKESAGDYDERCFLEEIRILWFCRQGSHIVTMLGICVSKRPYSYVMELVDGSNLEQLLEQRRLHLYGVEGVKLCFKAVCGIAHACIHLESLNVIHRDLAARNCLIGLDKRGNVQEVKLSDFGLAKELGQPKGSYDIPDRVCQRFLPTALLAPESHRPGKFNLATEVWAFGVFMWETFSLGEQPYAGIRNIEHYIYRGHRLGKPDLAPHETYALMTECWSLDPVQRPGFKHVLERLVLSRKVSAGKCPCDTLYSEASLLLAPQPSCSCSGDETSVSPSISNQSACKAKPAYTNNYAMNNLASKSPNSCSGNERSAASSISNHSTPKCDYATPLKIDIEFFSEGSAEEVVVTKL